jgi:putative membrane protein insertion efficiency factor
MSMPVARPCGNAEYVAPRHRGRWAHAATGLLVALIRLYQVSLRPLLIGHCKFCPTCSEYAIQALYLHGPLRGLGLTLRRVVRCHPFAPGGIDPVPDLGPDDRS